MNYGFLRQSASLSLSMLLLCLPAIPQQTPTWRPPQGEALAKPDPKKAQKVAELGDKAAAEGKFDAALALYEEAARYAPRDLAIVGRGAALRSRLVRLHVEAAERNAVDGHMDKATEELGAALRIDPGDAIIRERLAEMQSMEEEPSKAATTEIPGLPKLKPDASKHILNFRGDTKTVYEQVAQLFGVRVAFDPDLTPKGVRLRVDEETDFYTAMAILATQTATFWQPVDAKLLFVAADTAEKRKQYALEAVQTFTLPEAASPEELPDLLRVVRDMTGGTRLELDKDTRTITMRDTPAKLALAGNLIRELEKARGEILLEIEILEVDKNKARNLGITPPAQTQLITLSRQDLNILAQSTDLANLLTNLQQVFAGKGFSGIPDVLPFGGGLSTFLLTLPTTTLNLADTLSLVRTGNQVLLRAQDGKPATFFVGDRFPVTLSLLSGSGGINTGGFVGVPGSTTFPQTNFAVGANPSALAANNFTGGTLPDLAVVFNAANVNTFTILQNQDNGNFVQFTPSPITLSSKETGQVAIATAVLRTQNNNSTPEPPDVVLVNSTSNNISVLLGNVNSNGQANGTFTEATGSPIAVGTNPSSVVIADFNGDGFPDIAVANEGDNTISLFEGKGDGTFTAFPGSPFKLTNTAGTPEIGPIAMVSGNFRNRVIGTTTGNMQTNSPEVDLAVLNRTSSNVSILLSSVDTNGNVTFTESPDSPIALGPGTPPTPVSPVAIASADLNADGIPDLAIVTEGNSTANVASGVTILLGSTNLDGTFTAAQGSPLATAASPAGIAIANFAGGAVPDLAVTDQGANTLAIYLGLGQGTFSQRIELNTPNGPTALIAATLSSSGLPDAALLASGSTANQGDVTVILDSSALASTALASGIGGATNQVPYPGSQFEDLGVKIKATPSLHANKEVTLQLEFEIRALEGTSVNGIPVLSNRTLSQTVRVKEDEPTLISGLSQSQDTRTLTGLPGLSQIPGGLGYLFGSRATTRDDTELLILITPRRLRRPERKSRTIYAGQGEQAPFVNPNVLPSERDRTNP